MPAQDTGYYTVQRLNNQPGDPWKWKTIGYSPDGELVIEVVHKSDSSKDLECQTFEIRGFKFRQNHTRSYCAH